MATIQIRIDTKTKESAKTILDHLGIDMSTAIKVYLKQIIITKSVPLRLMTENGLSPKEEDYIVAAAKDAREGKNISSPMTEKEAIAYLKELA